jgi:hypothetical protein
MYTKSIIFDIEELGQQIHVVAIDEMPINDYTAILISNVVAWAFWNLPKPNRLY